MFDQPAYAEMCIPETFSDFTAGVHVKSCSRWLDTAAVVDGNSDT